MARKERNNETLKIWGKSKKGIVLSRTARARSVGGRENPNKPGKSYLRSQVEHRRGGARNFEKNPSRIVGVRGLILPFLPLVPGAHFHFRFRRRTLPRPKLCAHHERWRCTYLPPSPRGAEETKISVSHNSRGRYPLHSVTCDEATEAWRRWAVVPRRRRNRRCRPLSLPERRRAARVK